MIFSAQKAEGRHGYYPFHGAAFNKRYLIRQVMRISLVIAILSITSMQFIFASNVKAQSISNVHISVQLNQESFLSVIDKIEKNTPFRFLYRNEEVKELNALTLTYKDRTVEEVLQLLLSNTSFSFKQVDQNILITKRKEISPAILGKHIPIRLGGQVVDEEGIPLGGVTVMLKGSNKYSTATDENGHFSLEIPDQNSRYLVFTHLGFTTKEVFYDKEVSQKIVLNYASGNLMEVVVLGYTSQKKVSIIGSVATVSGEELKQSPSANVSNSLAGRLPGLIAYQGSGQPGYDDSRLLVRGLSSSTNSSPLIVIDGIPQEAVDRSGNIATAQLPHIDPNDIASISLLKDAGTAAVYGARAANGVILITTKRGEQGKTVLNYTFNGGWQKPTQLAKLVDSYTYATLANELYHNEGSFNPSAGKGYTDAQLEMIKSGSNPDLYANTNWYSALMKPSAFQQRHNLSLNGGTEKSKYFISAGYLDQDGAYAISGYKQYSLRSNLDADINKNLKLSLNLNGRQEKYTGQSANGVTSYYREISPLVPSQFSNGLYNYVTIPNGYSTLVNGSPYLMANGANGYSISTQNVFESIGSLIYTMPFVPGLSAKGTLSYNKYYGTSKIFNQPYVTAIRNNDGTYSTKTTGQTKASLTETFNQRETLVAEASLNYQRTFGKHAISAMALYTQTQNQGDYFLGTRTNFPSAAVDQLFAGDPTTAVTTGTAFKNARQSVVGRVSYNYEGKYLFESSFRYDGSDVFPKSDRFGFFPSVSAGWILSEEPFLKDIKAINFLKIRASYGQLGNDRVGQYQYLNTYSLGTGLDGYYTLGNVDLQALVPGVIPNVSFTWEKANILNLGFEAKLFNNLLGIEFDAFHKRTKDILSTRAFSIPATVGGSLPSENLAVVDNNGIELALTHENKIGQVRYSVKPNLTLNKNKLIYTPEPAGYLSYQSAIGRPLTILPYGMTSFLGYVAEGLYQSTDEIKAGPTPLYTNVAPGDIKYKDLNGDGKITPADRTVMGKGDYPGIIYGLSLGASYKGFDLNLLIQGAANVQKYMTGLSEWAFANNGVPSEKHLDRWTPSNPNASYPRLFSANLNNQAPSTYWFQNGAYARLKNVELAYNLPASVLSKVKLSSVRIYVSGTNLFTVTGLKDVDPEAAFSAFGADSYLIQKLYNIGLSVKF